MPPSADLHCHSYYSDGAHSPEFLCERAVQRGITHLAITDHDCLEAHFRVATDQELTLIPGIELSTDWNGLEIHVVGIGIDIHDSDLQALVHAQQQRRRARIEKFDERLRALSIHGLLEYMDNLQCHSYTRTHVADFLVAQGHSKNHQKAFKKYLARKGKIYVSAEWIGLATAVQTLNAAGGIAILAHPGRYPLSRSKLQALISDFQAAGGEAMETSYGNIDPVMRDKLSSLAKSCGLYSSQGSDFHSDQAHWTDLGRFPPLNELAKKNAIWLHPKWHFS